MDKLSKLRLKILAGRADANIDFSTLRQLLESLGFKERVRGDHHIFTRIDVSEIINLQPMRAKAKAYQVKQVRSILVKYSLGGTDVE
jgi:hypothetical protein